MGAGPVETARPRQAVAVGKARARGALALEARGRQKKIDGRPRTFAKSQTHPPTIRLFFPLTFCFSTFLGVSRQGEFKNTVKTFLQEVHVEKNPKIRQKFRCQFFLDFFCFIAFSGVFSDGSSETQQKTFYKKNRVEKFLQKARPEIENRFFLEFSFITFLGVSR
jgi:hypothetical protein